jgi:hypothetical protein
MVLIVERFQGSRAIGGRFAAASTTLRSKIIQIGRRSRRNGNEQAALVSASRNGHEPLPAFLFVRGGKPANGPRQAARAVRTWVSHRAAARLRIQIDPAD